MARKVLTTRNFEETFMHNEIQIVENLYYVGGSDRRISLFENVYPLANGIS